MEEVGQERWANLATSLFWAGLLSGRLTNSAVAGCFRSTIERTLLQVAINAVLGVAVPVVLVLTTDAPVLVTFSFLSGYVIGGICESAAACKPARCPPLIARFVRPRPLAVHVTHTCVRADPLLIALTCAIFIDPSTGSAGVAISGHVLFGNVGPLVLPQLVGMLAHAGQKPARTRRPS